MTLIGEIYRDGAAVPRSDQEASRWFRLASNLGDPEAAYELGAMLVQGETGVAKDPAAAKAQFERAAAKNHARRALQSWSHGAPGFGRQDA